MASQPSPILFAGTTVYFTNTMPPVVCITKDFPLKTRCSVPTAVANILNV